MSVMATTFTALAFNLTFLREQGILKRVRGTPLPAVSYFGGLLGSAVLNAFIQMGLVVLLGHLLYGVDWPQNWLLLVGFTALGVVCFGALGIAFSHAIPNFDAAPAYVNAVFLPAIFISGVFYSSDTLPAGAGGHRPGAAAQAPDRRPLAGDRGRPPRHAGGGSRGGGLGGRRATAGGALLPLGVARTAARARGGAASPRARGSPGSARRAGPRSGPSGRAPRGGRPRARPRSRAPRRAPAAGAS